MDGAIIISNDGGRIARANVHLVPDPTVPTSETGTRHRTAERVARSLDVPVVSASEEMGVINVYAGGLKRQLQEVGRLLDRANQALQTLERYKARLDDALASLTLEIEDVVTVRDVVTVIQRGEMVHRIADEIETMIIELGVDARLLRLQLDEIYTDIDDEVDLVIADYLPPHRHVEDTIGEMSRMRDDDVLDARMALATMHLGEAAPTARSPRGLRLLRRVSKLTPDIAASIVDRFVNSPGCSEPPWTTWPPSTASTPRLPHRSSKRRTGHREHHPRPVQRIGELRSRGGRRRASRR